MADKSGRQRYQFKFWLNALNDSDRAIGTYLESMKAARRMTAVIRDAIRLFKSLSEGDTSVLAELFPGIVEQIKATAPPTPADGLDDLKREIISLKQSLQAAPQSPLIASGEYLQPVINGHSKIGLDMPAMPSLFVAADDCPEDPSVARLAFAGGMGDLFADEDEDLWD